MFNKAMVCIDGSGASLKAVEAARSLFESGCISELTMVYVDNFLHTAVMSGGMGLDCFPDQLQKDMEKAAQKIIEKGKEILGHNIPVHTMVISGSPSEVILYMAHEDNYELIIVGNRGYSKLQTVLLGSVSHKVVNMAHCSVLVVR